MAVRGYEHLFIGGAWVPSEGTGKIEVVSPTTEEVVATVPDATTADVDRAVDAARQAFDHGPWPRMTPLERGAILASVAEAITAEMGDLAETISTEMGSPVSWAQLAQVLAPSMIFNYYAGLAGSFAFDEIRPASSTPKCW